MRRPGFFCMRVGFMSGRGFGGLVRDGWLVVVCWNRFGAVDH